MNLPFPERLTPNPWEWSSLISLPILQSSLLPKSPVKLKDKNKRCSPLRKSFWPCGRFPEPLKMFFWPCGRLSEPLTQKQFQFHVNRKQNSPLSLGPGSRQRGASSVVCAAWPGGAIGRGETLHCFSRVGVYEVFDGQRSPCGRDRQWNLRGHDRQWSL